jgi:hypothetical protein
MDWNEYRGAIVALLLAVVIGVGMFWAVKKEEGNGRRDVVDYPPAPRMPAVVNGSMEEWLAKLEGELQKKAPDVLTRLRSGLTDAQISALEKQFDVTLAEEVKALYRWRNGADDGKKLLRDIDFSHHFVSLEMALERRQSLLKDVSEGRHGRIAYRAGWVGMFEDYGGDGYYYDPARRMEEGAFFSSFTEIGAFTFFPSLKNYVAYLTDCWEADIKPGTLNEKDFERAGEIQKRYGARVSLLGEE